jgi:hypothetical protein
MRCFLVGISGYSRTGKDTVAHRLVKQHDAIHLGMTDHAKRHMADTYNFTEEQLFGPSEARNMGDLRYPKPIFFRNKCQRLGRPIEVFSRNSAEVFSGKETGKKISLDPEKVYYICEGRGPKGTEGLPYQPTKLGAARYFIEEGDPQFWLSPREILQQYCELLESLYLGSLIDYAVQTHLKLTPESDHGEGRGIFPYKYNRMTGLEWCNPKEIRDINGAFITCFSDFRRKHQIRGARNHAGNRLTPVMIRVKRPGIEKPPFKHISETEQAEIPDSAFDFVINNDGNFDDLNVKIGEIVQTFTAPGWEHLRNS